MQGEQLAHQCAKQQARIFNDPVAVKFFDNQAKQERFHARVFKTGIGIIKPTGINDHLGKKAFDDYGRTLLAAVERGDKLESLLGMQIVMEGLAEVSLQHISDGFPSRGVGFNRIRHLIVGQEEAHHQFGVKQLQTYLPEADQNKLVSTYKLYLELAEALLYSVRDLFHYFDEDADLYYAELLDTVPSALSEACT